MPSNLSLWIQSLTTLLFAEDQVVIASDKYNVGYVLKKFEDEYGT